MVLLLMSLLLAEGPGDVVCGRPFFREEGVSGVNGEVMPRTWRRSQRFSHKKVTLLLRGYDQLDY